MAESCLLYYITDRSAFPGDEAERRRRLLEKIAEASRAGVDYIQLREKDLSPRELEQLTRQAVSTIREAQSDTVGSCQPATALLINSRSDVALAAGADGVHLRSNDVAPREVRTVWLCGAGMCGAGTPARENLPADPIVVVSCHSFSEVTSATADGADFVVFAPVFEKQNSPTSHPVGVGALKEACSSGIPVLALGGITLANAASCLKAGAAGIAAIRLFQENDVAEVASKLRGMRC